MIADKIKLKSPTVLIVAAQLLQVPVADGQWVL